MSKLYRRIGKYTKSSQKYMLEKRRRREIVKFLTEGYTQAQIAQKLGVSARTVGRDVARLQPYLKRLEGEEKQRIDAMMTARCNATLAGLPAGERFHLVAGLWGADKKTKDQAFDALISGNLAALKLIALRDRDR